MAFCLGYLLRLSRYCTSFFVGNDQQMIISVLYVVDTYITYLELGLDLPQLAPGQHLDVRGDLLPRPRLARPQLDVARYQLVPACRSRKRLSN